MTVRNLSSMFRPRSVVLVGDQGASALGDIVVKNLLQGGFKGQVFGIEQGKRGFEGVQECKDPSDLPEAPDLAVITAPPETVPDWIKRLGDRGVKGAAVLSPGFGELPPRDGEALRKEMIEAARPHLLRILGPESLGLMASGAGLNAGLSHLQPASGKLAFVAQSGTVLTSVVDWAASRNIGFSHCVSLGDMIDVDFGDMLDYLGMDSGVRAILLYIEAVTHARKFMSAARAAARMKPVVVVKGGRHADKMPGASAWRRFPPGADAVYDAAFRRAGMLRVNDMAALFDAVETLASLRPVSDDRLAILTNGGGLGVLAADTLADKGGRLAELSEEAVGRLDEILPGNWSRGNPVDVTEEASVDRYARALEILLEERGADAVVAVNCPTALHSGTDAARAVIDVVSQAGSKYRAPAVLTSWPGRETVGEARRMLTENRIPTYETPSEAVRGFMQMVRYRQSQETLMETPADVPEAFTPDAEKARRIIKSALEQERSWLTDAEAKEILTAYAVPAVDTRVVESPEEAAQAASELGECVVLKIHSPDSAAKSEAGGVVLDLGVPELAREAASTMRERVRQKHPDARLWGFAVQPLVRYEHSHELLIRMVDDERFGPVLVFGHGGVAAEVIRDQALALPPLNMHLAREVMARTRIHRLLEGYDSIPAADMESAALTLVKVSQLVCDLPEIKEIEINPLLAHPEGVVLLDAKMKVRRTEASAADRLAIRPYPRELEEEVPLPDDKKLLLRPIKPEDEPTLHKLFASLSPEEIRLRFLHPMKSLSHAMAARLTQIDYDREMALVLTGEGEGGETEIFGVVRIGADPDNERAEFAVLLRRSMTGLGLGPMLLRRIIDYAKNRGIGEIYGEVLTENKTMLKLAKALGFEAKRDPEDFGIMHVSLKL